MEESANGSITLSNRCLHGVSAPDMLGVVNAPVAPVATKRRITAALFLLTTTNMLATVEVPPPALAQRTIGLVEAHVRSLQARFEQIETTRRAWISTDWQAAIGTARTLDDANSLDSADSLSTIARPSTSSTDNSSTPEALLSMTNRNPLSGLVIAVKDNIDVVGFPTTSGSRSLRANRPSQDATVVALLRLHGAIIAGKTNLDTFARGVRTVSEVRGTTANAWDSTRAAGGSSGGSAVAVATGMADAALGTDTCGSLRYPATYNGIYALRPTSGALSRNGIVPLSPTQDVVGPMASSPTVLRQLFTVLVGPDPLDPTATGMTRMTGTASETQRSKPETQRSKPFRVGVLNGFGMFPVDAKHQSPLDGMRNNGMELVPVTVPKGVANANLINVEADAAIATYRQWVKEKATGPRGIPPWLHRSWRPPGSNRWESLRAHQRLNAFLITELLDEAHLDAVVYPTTQFPAATLGSTQPSANCWLSATSGLPALALPGGLDPKGFPVVGLDLLGRAFDEFKLLAIADAALPRNPDRIHTT